MTVILLSSLSVFAQSTQPAGTFSIVPKIGLNIANVSKIDKSDPRYGIVGGAEFQYQATDLFALSVGALYSQQGFKVEGNLFGVKLSGTEKADYVNFPILANVYVVPGLAVKVGVQPALNVTEGSFPNVNKFECSVPVGLSYEIMNIVLDARYNFGVTKMWKDIEPKSSVFQFTLGYRLNL